MFFLWKIYLKNKNIPNTILKSEFENIIKDKLSNNNNYFTSIKSIYLTKVKLFQKFWQKTIVKDINDSIEITNIALLIKWLKIIKLKKITSQKKIYKI